MQSLFSFPKSGERRTHHERLDILQTCTLGDRYRATLHSPSSRSDHILDALHQLHVGGERMKIEQQQLPFGVTPSKQLKRMSRNTDPSTSAKAAAKALPRVDSDKRKVLDIFDAIYPNGLCDEQLEEIAVEQGMWPGNAPKRRSDLSKDGWLERTGETRISKANKEQDVHRRKR